MGKLVHVFAHTVL